MRWVLVVVMGVAGMAFAQVSPEEAQRRMEERAKARAAASTRPATLPAKRPSPTPAAAKQPAPANSIRGLLATVPPELIPTPDSTTAQVGKWKQWVEKNLNGARVEFVGVVRDIQGPGNELKIAVVVEEDDSERAPTIRIRSWNYVNWRYEAALSTVKRGDRIRIVGTTSSASLSFDADGPWEFCFGLDDATLPDLHKGGPPEAPAKK